MFIKYLFSEINIIMLLVLLNFQSKDVVSGDGSTKVNVPEALECYQGKDISPESLYNAEDCTHITGMLKVSCQNNVTSCYAFVDFARKIQLGCATANECVPEKGPKKIFTILCCQSSLCNCDINRK
jgi:hypothetical protein